jgi:hypothetical protein
VAEGHTYRGVAFDSNSHTTTQTCSDFNNLGSTIESLVAPVFGGASGTTTAVPLYNVYNAAGARTAVLGPVFGNGGTSATPTFANDFTRIVLNQYGVVNVGNVAPTNSGFMFSVNDSRQFYGQVWSNGANVFASLSGLSPANDNGLFKLLNGGTVGAQLAAAGNYNFVKGNMGFGGQTSPAYPVDVTGAVHATAAPLFDALTGFVQCNGTVSACSASNNISAGTGGFTALTVTNATQYNGLILNNGTSTFAKIFGASTANDNGVLDLLSGGAVQVQLASDGGYTPNYIKANVGFGGQTSPSYPVDVTGQINASTGYRASGVAGVSCSGAPSGSFAVTNGIVTHC